MRRSEDSGALYSLCIGYIKLVHDEEMRRIYSELVCSE